MLLAKVAAWLYTNPLERYVKQNENAPKLYVRTSSLKMYAPSPLPDLGS